MKISVITCTWNSEPYLAESISSVLSQTHADIEYIFVDGGSTDGTLERIAAIDVPVKLVRNVRGGISKAMNEGVIVATGEVIAHLHSDDFYLDQNVLSDVANAMAQSNCGWCFGRIKRLKDGVITPESYVPPKYTAQRLLQGNFIPHPATFVRREWMNHAGRFDETLKYAMDYDLWLKLASRGDALELHRPLAVFRDHAGSLSSSNRIAAFEEDYKVRQQHCSNQPLQSLEHRIRYWVRRYRMNKLIKA